MQCIILAGGFGTRLKTAVSDRPKCLALINNYQTPFLELLINYLSLQGVTRFLFSLGFLHEQVLEYLTNNQKKLNYIYEIENTPLGTGGAIKNIFPKIEDDNVLIVNADTFFDINLADFLFFHKNNQSKCTIALKRLNNYDRYGTVRIDNKSKIISFIEKQYTEIGFINAGLIFLNVDYFNSFTLPTIFSFENDFLTKIINSNNIFGYNSEGYFIDIGIPDDYVRAQTELSKFSTYI